MRTQCKLEIIFYCLLRVSHHADRDEGVCSNQKKKQHIAVIIPASLAAGSYGCPTAKVVRMGAFRGIE